MVNVAIIGTGYMGKVHLETLMKMPNVQIKAIADSNIGMAEKLARSMHIKKFVKNYEDLLDDSDIEVFHNCTPNHLHFDINRKLLQAGKHVLSEKPLALSVKEAEILKNIAESKNLVVGINFCYRYYPVVQEAAARIRNNKIGKVNVVKGCFLQDWLLYETDYNWRLDSRYSGISNAIADIGSHWCDLAQYVTGLKIVEVMGDLSTIIPVRRKSKEEVLTFSSQENNNAEYEDVPVKVDDYGSVLVHFNNGAKGVFTVCQLCAGRKVTIDLQVYGSRSSLAWNHEQPSTLWVGNRDRGNEIFIESPILQDERTRRFALLPSGHPMGYHDAVYNMFSDFYNAVRLKKKGIKPDFEWPDFNTGYEETKIVEAVVESHNKKKWIKINI